MANCFELIVREYIPATWQVLPTGEDAMSDCFIGFGA
jgi:hypothetical protein